MTDGAPAPAPRRRPRWTTLALLASLGLNLAFVGLVAGLAFRGPPGPGRDVGLWAYGFALPDPYRGDLARALRGGRAEWEGPRARLRETRAALAAALTAEPYDPAAVAAVFADERRTMGELAERGSALLIAQIDRMDAEERRAYAERLIAGKGEGRREGPRPGRD